MLSINTSYVYSIGFNILNSERAWLARFQGEYETNMASDMLNLAYAFGKGENPADLAKLKAEFDAEILAITSEIRKLVIELEETGRDKLTEN